MLEDTEVWDPKDTCIKRLFSSFPIHPKNMHIKNNYQTKLMRVLYKLVTNYIVIFN